MKLKEILDEDSSKIKIYKVIETKLYIGSRIEGFNINVRMFIDQKKALDFAYQLAKKYFDQYGQNMELIDDDDDEEKDDEDDDEENEEDQEETQKKKKKTGIEYKDDGFYFFPDSSYEQWGYCIKVTLDYIDFNNDIINVTNLQDS